MAVWAVLAGAPLDVTPVGMKNHPQRVGAHAGADVKAGYVLEAFLLRYLAANVAPEPMV